jgi:hypothetical protein
MRPTGIADWARAGGASAITEPTENQKNAGWAPGQLPPAQYFNWLQRNAADWIRNLSYDWMVNDDFIRSPHLTVSQGDTGAFYPQWAADNAIVMATVATGAMGVARLVGSVAFIEAYVGNVAGRDYCAEFIAMGVSHGSTGSAFAMGLRQDTPSGANSLAVWFGATGPTGLVFFGWRPTPGSSPTMIDLGITHWSASAYRRYEFERMGSTMVVNVDGLQKAVIRDAPSPMDAGVFVECGMSGTAGGSLFQVDRVRFGVRR